jgi:hypothetical protein
LVDDDVDDRVVEVAQESGGLPIELEVGAERLDRPTRPTDVEDGIARDEQPTRLVQERHMPRRMARSVQDPQAAGYAEQLAVDQPDPHRRGGEARHDPRHEPAQPRHRG